MAVINKLKSLSLGEGTGPFDKNDWDSIAMDDVTGVITCSKDLTGGRVRYRCIRNWSECTYILNNGTPE